jgi:aromatic-amino-acid transaminase
LAAYRQDQRPGKLDLGVGVYRDADARTPVMRAVKAAEQVLLERQETKSYLGPEGDAQFTELLRPIVFGAREPQYVVGLQTPGGTGALRLAADLIAQANPTARVWVGHPTWPNHVPILAAARLRIAYYPHADLSHQVLALDRMIEALGRAAPGDVVLLHGCCHNPTGIDPGLADWGAIAEHIARRGLVPLIDFAYQGFGQDLDEDRQGLDRILSEVGEVMIAYSCDKNFGLYRERTGALYCTARDASEAEILRGTLEALARVTWSMPPDHGAAAVRIVLESPQLEREWRTELGMMHLRIEQVRTALAIADPDFAFLTRQRGMFSNLRLSPQVVAELREKHAVYVAPSGRINLAGLRQTDIDTFLNALKVAAETGHRCSKGRG